MLRDDEAKRSIKGNIDKTLFLKNDSMLDGVYWIYYQDHPIKPIIFEGNKKTIEVFKKTLEE